MRTTDDNDLHQMMMNYQIKPASDVAQLKLEEVEEVGGQVPAQSSQVSN